MSSLFLLAAAFLTLGAIFIIWTGKEYDSVEDFEFFAACAATQTEKALDRGERL